MFEIIKCRGVLYKMMQKNIQQISIVSFFLFTIPLIILSLWATTESTIGRICAGLFLWYMSSLIILKKVDYDNNFNKVLTLPVFLSIKLSVIIFRFFLIRKYPEMEEEHYERWVKLKKLQKQIKIK
jgi:hypothetical protein